MEVRNQLLKLTKYKGRWSNSADQDCPCRSCFNAHDCGYRKPKGAWVISMECATRYNMGCPQNMIEPIHIFKHTKRFQNRKRNDIFKCLRCGQKLIMSKVNFIIKEIEKD